MINLFSLIFIVCLFQNNIKKEMFDIKKGGAEQCSDRMIEIKSLNANQLSEFQLSVNRWLNPKI